MSFNGVTSNAAWDLIKSLSSYYGLRDYLESRYVERFRPTDIKEIYAYKRGQKKSGEAIFWREVLNGGLQAGDRVKLINFQISPWFPRKPGSYWTSDAAKARRIAVNRHVQSVERDLVVFDLHGKTLMTELGGLGTVNFRKNRDTVLFTATASGHTERGIPLLCSSAIWGQIDRNLRRSGRIEIDLEGKIEPVPIMYDSFFLRSPGIPKIAIRVGSILSIKIKVSRLNIIVTPWTLFETQDQHNPYGFTYVTHELFNDAMRDSISWMLNYVDDNGGTVVLTDFDEETNSLNARFPLSGCADGSILQEKILRYTQNIWRKFHGDERLELFR